MRRFIALILMLIVPLQFAWSAAAGVHGHLGENVAALGAHAHDHDNHDGEHADHDVADDTDKGHNEDGHHGSHYHPVFSSILMETGLSLGISAPDGPPPHPLAAFLSHTPPLFDRPPLARA
ncbi:MAG: hypothetical protein KKG92_08620 [Gammaproteobacteria bacterium]|nr:hypothetical protein [Gammaproteobacteria bacterium]